MAHLGPYVNYILSALSVDPQENTNLVNLRFSHPNPETALNVVDTLAREFIENDYKYETSDSEAALDKIGRQVAQVQQTLRDQEQKRLEYLKRHHLPLGQGQGRNITTERLATLSEQLLAAEHQRKILETVYDSARSAKDIMSIPQVRDSEGIQAMRKAISDLEQKRAALLEVYTTDWPELKKIDAQLRQTKNDMSARASEAFSALNSNFRAAVDTESKLREAYLKEQGAANGQSQDEIELASLNQQIETNKQIYNTLFQRQKELEIDASNKSNHVTIVTPAALPLEPIGLPRFSKVA